ncbi:MAG: hypothetical protein AB9842_09420 [Bacteroidales bacterium]
MKIYHDLSEVREIKNAVVTTGSFDGVHIGHKTILNQLNQSAREINGESVLITFHPHPRKILYPETAGKNLFLINSQREKIELLQKTGLNHLVIIKFTLEFANISSFDFIRKILVGKLHAKKVIIGFNHHFGHNQEGDLEVLSELGKYHQFEVEEIPEQDIENETVSSTRIRKALLEGKIQRANAYLDHYYMMIGKTDIVKMGENNNGGDRMSVRIEEDCKLVPPDGSYAVSFQLRNQPGKGLVIVRDRMSDEATPGNHKKIVELITLNNIKPINSEEVTLYFHKLIREWKTEEATSLSDALLGNDKKEIEELIY